MISSISTLLDRIMMAIINDSMEISNQALRVVNLLAKNHVQIKVRKFYFTNKEQVFVKFSMRNFKNSKLVFYDYKEDRNFNPKSVCSISLNWILIFPWLKDLWLSFSSPVVLFRLMSRHRLIVICFNCFGRIILLRLKISNLCLAIPELLNQMKPIR